MAMATFDTLAFVESLEASGFTKEQSKGMVNAFRNAQEAQIKELATKGDLRELETRLMGELHLVKWMLALVVASTVIPAFKTLFG